MADTAEFFATFLPNKLEANPSLKDIGKTFLFDIDGAGKWTLNLTEGTVVEGGEEADCTVTCDKENWEKMLDNPSIAMQLFGMQKLKVDNLQLGLQLQKILG